MSIFLEPAMAGGKMINPRTKGASGEREVCTWLNSVVTELHAENGIVRPDDTPVFQRNQNQSAVGGSDITNPFDLCIEVKRQEILQLDKWWEQCTTASDRFGGIPILLFRQNGKRRWNAMMMVSVEIDSTTAIKCKGILSQDNFDTWIRNYLTVNYF